MANAQANPKMEENPSLRLPILLLIPEMQCSRNKAIAVLKELARTAQRILIERMKTGPFTISTDGSNDAHSKQFSAVHPDTCAVSSELLSLVIC